jgi:hypothetical protein
VGRSSSLTDTVTSTSMVARGSPQIAFAIPPAIAYSMWECVEMGCNVVYGAVQRRHRDR